MALAAAHLSVLHRDMAACQGKTRQAADRLAFEDIVIDGRLLPCRRDRLGLRRVQHDQIGIRPDQHRALPGIEVQDLGDIGRGDGDKFVRRQPSRDNAMGPEHRQSVFQPAGAVRDLGEIAKPEPLLLGGEGAMVGRHHRQRAGLQAGPQAVLMLLAAEWRAHHPLCGMVPVGMGIFAVVQRQVLDQGFTPDPLALLARAADRLMRLFAGGVHDIQRHARHVGDHDRPVRCLTFHRWRARIGMGLGPGIALGQQPGLQLGHHIAVLGMDKRHTAQVTHPPIDPIREYLVMSLEADLGPERNILVEAPEHARVVHLPSPLLYTHQLEALKAHDLLPARTIDMTWPLLSGPDGLSEALQDLCEKAEAAVMSGAKLLVLSDRAINHERVGIPSLLAVGAVHHYLSLVKKRMHTSLIVETAEARDTHHIACLIGFGATAVCPWLAHETVRELVEKNEKGKFDGISVEKALTKYHQSLEKGILKIMSKMGISVLNSYQGAQIFEAVGIASRVIKRCFAGTPSQIAGVGFYEIAAESIARHTAAFRNAVPNVKGELDLGDPGFFRFRRDGEIHAVSGGVIKNFHTFVKSNKAEDYEKYLEELKLNQPHALHDLFELVPNENGPIPLDEVEPIESVRRRFTTAAMSLGAISPEAHETLAIAMNRIGGKSDSGEGGEDPRRYKPYANGDWGNSKIKQVASGRFGVSAAYLMSAEEIEIKMAQGAKPGEGGQLPGSKVNGLIARLRNTQPGVTLISPPPHHDIYSIEDLAQLIHDLKQVNPTAKVTVKLVAETGVGTVAAGVAKAKADIILISGHDGGTGASPISSIKHAGLPWELGLAEAQQVLMLNGLRNRVTLRTDGGLRSGLDIIHAAILGAEEYNFGTIALIAMGCVYVRRCHLNNCPVGVATQDPKYRAKFKGEVDHVVNFFNAVSEEVRQHMASLGVRKLDDLIGRPEYLRQRKLADHPKANLIDLSRLLADVGEQTGKDLPRICLQDRNDGIQKEPPLDDQILADLGDKIEKKEAAALGYPVKNTHRNIGTKLAGAVAKLHGDHGLAEGTLDITLTGSAGQSFGTFLCGGIRLTLIGEANDYVGKGMAGGEIRIKPVENRSFDPAENSILGNTVMYGASGGRLFANGRGGERFGVRNSGGIAVVEGIGDHGCEYMTNGTVVVLGSTGKNFGAGMSGGEAFIYDEEGRFEKLFNDEMVEIVRLPEDGPSAAKLRGLIEAHIAATGSGKGRAILENWSASLPKFWRVKPQGGLAGTVEAKAGEMVVKG